MPYEETEKYIRSGHGSPAAFDPKSYRTITIKKGIKAIVGCPKGKYVGGRCKVGMRVKSYLFSKSAGWTKEKAKAWVSKHKKAKKKEPIVYPAIKEEPSKRQLRLQLKRLREQRQALWKQDTALWRKARKIFEPKHRKLNEQERLMFKDEHEKIGKKLDAISSEIRALEVALGIEISERPVKEKVA